MGRKSLIILISYNSEKFIEDCLLSVFAQKYRDWFLVVADNGSRDRTVQIIKRVRNFCTELSSSNFKLIRFSKNLGFSRAIDRVFFKYLEGGKDFSHIVLINPDMRLGRNAIGRLVEPLADGEVGVCGGLILDYGSNKIQHLGGKISPNFLTEHIGLGMDYSQLKDQFKQDAQGTARAIRDVTYTTGALFATSRKLFYGLGGLDGGYRPAYFEELDYCLKALRANKRVVVNPLARARHAEAVSSKKYSKKFYKLYHKNRLRCAVLHAKLFYAGFLKEEGKWLKNQATRDQYWPLALAYAINMLLFPLNGAARIKNHFILNKLQLK